MKGVAGRLVALVLILTLIGGAWWYAQRPNGGGGDDGPAEVLILVPPAQARWIQAERDRFNVKNRGLYHVDVTVRGPDAARKEILAGRLRPAACGADDPRWIKALIAAWAAGHRGAHIAAQDDPDDYYVYFRSPRVTQTRGDGQAPRLTNESDALVAAATDAHLRVTYPKTPGGARRCAATLSAPWVTGDQHDGAQAFLKFLSTRSALRDGLRDHWRPVTSDAELTLTPELRRYAGQGFGPFHPGPDP